MFFVLDWKFLLMVFWVFLCVFFDIVFLFFGEGCLFGFWFFIVDFNNFIVYLLSIDGDRREELGLFMGFEWWRLGVLCCSWVRKGCFIEGLKVFFVEEVLFLKGCFDFVVFDFLEMFMSFNGFLEYWWNFWLRSLCSKIGGKFICLWVVFFVML